MVEITWKAAKRLRDATGAGFTACRQALAEAGGDLNEAETLLRERGFAIVDKKAKRLPPERWVGCACPPGMARPILEDSTGHNFLLSGCVRCGKVEAVRVFVEEPHRGLAVGVANEVVPLSPEAQSWVGQWPRRLGCGWGRCAYLPASARCENAEDLAAVERRALEEQRGMDIETKLRRAGIPDAPPPPMPPHVEHLLCPAWEALSLPQTPTEDRLRWALDLLSGCRSRWAIVPADSTAFRVLAPRLAGSSVLIRDLAGDDAARQQRAVEVLADLPRAGAALPPAELILPPLLRRLSALDAKDNREIRSILGVLSLLGPQARAAEPTLRKLHRICSQLPGSRRWMHFDESLVKRIGEVLRSMSGRTA